MKKRILLSIFSALACILLFPSFAHAQVGIEAGYINSKFPNKSDGNTLTGNPYHGFKAGVTYHLSLDSYFALQTGLAYSYIKGKGEATILIPVF